MKNTFIILLIACFNISCMQAQNIDKRMFFSYKGESDKPIPTIVLSVNEFKPKDYSYYEVYRVNERLFDALNKAIGQNKILVKTTSEKESIYEISIINSNQFNLFLCKDKQCIAFTLSDIIQTLTFHESPVNIIKSFENIKNRLR